MNLVIVESPFRGGNLTERRANVKYAYKCLLDCISRGEAPFASHLFYPQFLDEDNYEDRVRGIALGYAWGKLADLHIFYTDRGWSKGMLLALARCREKSLRTEFRSLGGTTTLPPQPDNSPIEEVQ